MTTRLCGFCLVEALISVLVLSIGLLGLAQLQARLTSNANDLHASGLARRLALTELEQALFTLGTAPGSDPSSTRELITPATRFQAVTSAITDPVTATISVVVSWEDRSAARSFELHGAAANAAPVTDARWLLAVGDW